IGFSHTPILPHSHTLPARPTPPGGKLRPVRERVVEPERMDAPAADEAELARSLRDVELLNRFFGGRAALRAGVARLLAERERGSEQGSGRVEAESISHLPSPISFVDIATGAADL